MRIAIVNDTQIALEALRRIIAAQPEHQIAWVANDGAEAVKKCAADTPDLILMDIFMPVMDGIEATRCIMQQSPCAILVVTATLEESAGKVFEAMGAGALDAISTPSVDREGKADSDNKLLTKIRMVSKLLGADTRKEPAVAKPIATAKKSKSIPLIAIGASTGGPAALATILAGLPADLNAAIVIVQHIDKQFSAELAAWLDNQTALRVRPVAEGAVMERGTVLVAETNDHMALNDKGLLTYTAEPAHFPYRPSVDVFFESLAKFWPTPSAAVLLTGMGKDGAAGLLTLRKAGWWTIAQSEQSCAVYGMPKAAVDLNAAREVLPPPAIVKALLKYVADRRTGRAFLRAI